MMGQNVLLDTPVRPFPLLNLLPSPLIHGIMNRHNRLHIPRLTTISLPFHRVKKHLFTRIYPIPALTDPTLLFTICRLALLICCRCSWNCGHFSVNAKEFRCVGWGGRGG